MGVYCAALDPGGTTGVILVLDEAEPWQMYASQMGGEPHHGRLLRNLFLWKPSFIVCESFQNRSQEAVLLASAEYLGVVKAYAESPGVSTKLILQTASQAKAFWSDHKLAAYNLVLGPQYRHAKDAMRHYLYWRTFTIGDQRLLTRSVDVSVSKKRPPLLTKNLSQVGR